MEAEVLERVLPWGSARVTQLVPSLLPWNTTVAEPKVPVMWTVLSEEPDMATEVPVSALPMAGQVAIHVSPLGFSGTLVMIAVIVAIVVQLILLVVS